MARVCRHTGLGEGGAGAARMCTGNLCTYGCCQPAASELPISPTAGASRPHTVFHTHWPCAMPQAFRRSLLSCSWKRGFICYAGPHVSVLAQEMYNCAMRMLTDPLATGQAVRCEERRLGCLMLSSLACNLPMAMLEVRASVSHPSVLSVRTSLYLPWPLS